MRRLKIFFDFKFEISVKFPFEWCMLIYDSLWFRLRFLVLVYTHAYANIRTWEISRWIIYQHTSFEGKFYAEFEFEVKNLIQPTHSGENHVLKICVGVFSKFLFDWIRNQISIRNMCIYWCLRYHELKNSSSSKNRISVIT